MKLTISKRELLAICMHTVPKPCSPEQAPIRREAWRELGVAELALDMADMYATAGAGLNPGSPWMDRKAMMEVEISTHTRDFLVRSLAGDMAGMHAEYLRPLADRIKDLSAA